MDNTEYHNIYDKYRQAVFRNNILSLLKIEENDEKSITALIDCMLNYRTCDYHNCRNRFIYIFELFIALLIFKFRYIPNNLHFFKENILLVETTDRYNNLEIVNEAYPNSAFLFFPIFKFHVQDAAIDYLKGKKIKYYFVNYKVQDVLWFLFTSIKVFKSLNSFTKEIKLNADSMMSCNKVYDCLLKLFFYKKVLRGSMWEDKIMMWRYDMSVEHLALYLQKDRIRNNVSVGVNHGTFFDFNITYTRSFSDYQMCVSEREKRDIIKYGSIKADHVFAIGGPLQMFSKENVGTSSNQTAYNKKGILVLLTNTSDILDEQIDVLKLLDKECKFEIVCRFRPASYIKDMGKLKPFIPKNAIISTNKYLSDDVNKCNAIISFSLDAFPMCYNSNKRCFLFCDNLDYSIVTDSFMVTDSMDNLRLFLINADKKTKFDNTVDNYYLFSFGETKKEKVLNLLKHSISVIEGC